MPDATRSQPSKLLDEIRQALHLHHYSIHTERSTGERTVRPLPRPAIINTHRLQPGGQGVPGPWDELGV